ncbi:MAG: hypothetical protein KGJ86_04110 [Chloroflexota bacterium]|nr:hypothetical protein [Chloroflexota bacterium]
MEIVVRNEAGLWWVHGIELATPNWWPESVPWPREGAPTPMSTTLWTVLLRRAVEPDWELAGPPIDLGGNRQKLTFRARWAEVKSEE